ncbi:MAG: hypothetical protein GF315_10415 [candidate division Zixibacteria bacterium]|nr:hypothetical protein [candidate division Zixibacteria bacterium]
MIQNNERKDNTYRRMQRMVDYLCRKIENRTIEPDAADKMERRIKAFAETHFADKLELYEMIYTSRFKRLKEQYLHLQ